MFSTMSMFRSLIKKLNEKPCSYCCPVCEKPVAGFLPLPDFYREQAQLHGYLYSFDDAETLNYKHYSCPHCYSSDRDRLYALFVREKAAIADKSRKLDLIEFAPSQALGQMIIKLGVFNLRTADLIMEGVTDKINLEDMSLYPDSSFDGFICSHVLEHVPDDRKALRELQRILKPGGWGILMVPVLLAIADIDEDPLLTDEGERWRRFGQNDHVRMYSKKGFLQRIAEAGFWVQQYGWQHFGKDAFSKSGIAEKSILYIVEKVRDGLDLSPEPA